MLEFKISQLFFSFEYIKSCAKYTPSQNMQASEETLTLNRLKVKQSKYL